MKHILFRTTDTGDNLTITVSDEGTSPTNKYWSVTGEMKAPNSRTVHSCGCLHDDVLKAAPELKPFIDLHLSNIHGIPMHALENGAYYIQCYWEEKLPGRRGARASLDRKTPEQWLEVIRNHFRVDFDSEIGKQIFEIIKRYNPEDQDVNAKTMLKNLIDNSLRHKWNAEAHAAKILLAGMIAESKEAPPELPKPDVIMSYQYHGQIDSTTNSYTVVLKKNRRSAAFPWKMGVARNEVVLDDVLECLCRDARDVEDNPDFDQWARDLGLGTDSLEAKKMFKAVKRQTKAFKRLLGDDYDRVCNMYG